MRNCQYIGNPAMFRSRVSGVGGLISKMLDDSAPITIDLSQIQCIGPGCQMDGGLRLAVCHPQSPVGTCMPVDWTPPAVVPDAPAKPTASTFPLLLLGAAFLLLS